MNQYLSCRNAATVDQLDFRTAMAAAIAGKIINIAGLASQTRVLCLGDIGSTIEAAVTATGARMLTAGAIGRRPVWRSIPTVRADVVLWALAPPRNGAASETRGIVRRYLRGGGRLVLWTVPQGEPDACMVRDAFQRLVRPPMFSSAIVGRLPASDGGAVVATGILTLQSNGHREDLL